MKVAGIIAEYNPIHKGHIYHIEETKKRTNADIIVAVMSGNFTQRGEPAILDKWTRAKLAVGEGIDLCLEMPVNFACNSAEQFAEGGVKILNGIGTVDYLSFGCEAHGIDELLRVAEILVKEPEEYKERLKYFLDKGNSFPQSRELALATIWNESINIIKEPNNILAIEYLKWLIKTESSMVPVAVKRKGMGHLETATKVREKIFGGKTDEIEGFLSAKVLGEIENKKSILVDKNAKIIYQLLRYSIITTSQKKLSEVYGTGEGIENKLIKTIRKQSSMEELIEELKSKRYTRTRINRILFQTLLGITKESYMKSQENIYTRVLAFNEKGREILRKIKKEEKSKIKIFDKIDQKNEEEYIDIRATDIYNIISGQDLFRNSDYVKYP